MPYRFPTLGQRDLDAVGAEEHRRGDLLPPGRPHDQGRLGPLRAQRARPGGLLAQPARARVPAARRRLRARQRLGGVLRLPLRRYHYGQRASGRWVDGFELVNEPNLQLWPQQAPSADPADAWAIAATSIEAAIARLMKTAQGISSRYAHSTMLYAPSISDSDTASSRLLHALRRVRAEAARRAGGDGYLAHSRQAWSHHNYTDVEKRQTSTRTQLIRGAAQGPLVRLQQRPVADGLRDRGRRAAVADARALPGRGSAPGAGEVPARRVGAAPARRAAPGPAWRCSRSTCSTPTPTSTAVCSTRTRAR